MRSALAVYLSYLSFTQQRPVDFTLVANSLRAQLTALFTQTSRGCVFRRRPSTRAGFLSSTANQGTPVGVECSVLVLVMRRGSFGPPGRARNIRRHEDYVARSSSTLGYDEAYPRVHLEIAGHCGQQCRTSSKSLVGRGLRRLYFVNPS